MPPSTPGGHGRSSRAEAPLSIVASLCTIAGIIVGAERWSLGDSVLASDECQVIAITTAVLALVLEPLYSWVKFRIYRRVGDPERSAWLRETDEQSRQIAATSSQRFRAILAGQLLATPPWTVLAIWLILYEAGDAVVYSFSAASLWSYVYVRFKRDRAKRQSGYGRTWDCDPDSSVAGVIGDFVRGRTGRHGPSAMVLCVVLAVTTVAFYVFLTRDGLTTFGDFRERVVHDVRNLVADDEADPAAQPAATTIPTVSTPPATTTASSLDGPRTRVVRDDDNLWVIAYEEFQRRLGRPPTQSEVFAYWLEVMRANAGDLRIPGNYDLIYPGDVVTVPPVTTNP